VLQHELTSVATRNSKHVDQSSEKPFGEERYDAFVSTPILLLWHPVQVGDGRLASASDATCHMITTAASAHPLRAHILTSGTRKENVQIGDYCAPKQHLPIINLESNLVVRSFFTLNLCDPPLPPAYGNLGGINPRKGLVEGSE
jgi:hypothetical protein